MFRRSDRAVAGSWGSPTVKRNGVALFMRVATRARLFRGSRAIAGGGLRMDAQEEAQKSVGSGFPV
jgi:hypothetical protein